MNEYVYGIKFVMHGWTGTENNDTCINVGLGLRRDVSEQVDQRQYRTIVVIRIV